MSISFTFFVESLAKGVTFSVLRDSFTKANIGLTYMGTRNVVFFSHFNIFTLCMQLHIFLKMALKKKGHKFCTTNVYCLFLQGCLPIKWTAPEILLGELAGLSTLSDVYV